MSYAFKKHTSPATIHLHLPTSTFHIYTQPMLILFAVKDTVSFKPLDTTLDDQGRFIILICEINTVVYTIINIYASNTRQILFINKIWKKIQKKCLQNATAPETTILILCFAHPNSNVLFHGCETCPRCLCVAR